MASKRSLRSAVKAAQQQLDAVTEQDYLGPYPATRSKIHDGASGRSSRTKVAEAPLNDRAARTTRRAAAKRSHAEEPKEQVRSTRRGKRQRMTEDEEYAEHDEEHQEEEDEEVDGVDHDRIIQAMNQAGHGLRRTVNGLVTRHDEQSQEEDDDEQEEEGDQVEPENEEGLLMSRSSEEPRGQRPETTPNDRHRANISNEHNTGPKTQANARTDPLYEFQASSPEKSRTRRRVVARRGTKNKQTAPRHISLPATSQRRRPAPSQQSSDGSASDSDNEARGDTTVNLAEDSAFIEAPQPDEKLVLVKLSMNSMGGMIKTLRHQAWARRADWDRRFESNDKSDGDVTACKTVSGRLLMKAIMDLKRLLEKAIDTWKESEEDYDDPRSMTAYLRGKGADIERCFARVNRAIEHICTEELAQPPQPADEESARRAMQARQRLLREISRRLIPMLVLVVKKTCELAPSEVHQSKKTVYFNPFTLQLFLRTLSWTSRLHTALDRGLKEWPFEAEFIKDENELDQDDRDIMERKMKARDVFEDQLLKLLYSAKDAERAIQDRADQEERQRREAAIRRRFNEEARLAQAAKERRETEERRQREEKSYAAFANFTQRLKEKPDPMKQLWLQHKADMERASRSASGQNKAPARGSHGQGRRTSGTVQSGAGRSEAGPSRNVQMEEDLMDFDPFADNPSEGRNLSSLVYAHNRPNGSGITHHPSQESRPWTNEEDKVLIKSIRYDRTYNLVSMATQLGRTEDDVARKVASLKQGYRDVYTERRKEIPAWAW
ncbi:hypothetical protein VM1G_05138 [Cytospora mali]|uniref:Uncharacterized protein n=1 Tax=Cytospora mali TaxID=578113 RepID=A0A194VZC9_CYTMA|nr:hypothetical protein VM1G_05138 [Valsa mali]